jgi:hypothetical protein
MTIDELACMAFGFAYALVLPDPLPPTIITLRLRRCLCASKPIRVFWVRILFSVKCLSAYLRLTAAASPHFALPCSSRGRVLRRVAR